MLLAVDTSETHEYFWVRERCVGQPVVDEKLTDLYLLFDRSLRSLVEKGLVSIPDGCSSEPFADDTLARLTDLGKIWLTDFRADMSGVD